MAGFFDPFNPMLWIVAGLALVAISFIFIMFKWFIGKKY